MAGKKGVNPFAKAKGKGKMPMDDKDMKGMDMKKEKGGNPFAKKKAKKK